MVDKHNLRENSLFIYASDHGLSGKWSLQEQGLKVPLIARWPSKIKANSTSEIMLSLVDVLPTILEITDTKIPEDIDGKAFTKHLLNNFGIEIGGGLGDLAGKVWRIGLMGYNSTSTNVDKIINIFETELPKFR